jgi:hypothetical protein
MGELTVHKMIKRGMVIAALAVVAAAWPSMAHAQRRGFVHRGGVVFVGGYFYDPYFGPYPWWGPSAYPYPYYPVYDNRADVRVLATPKDAAVYVDGYYAGVVDDFDGVFQRLPLSPGAHEIVLFREGYQTAHQRLHLSPGSTYKVRFAMEKLAAGQVSEPPPLAPAVPPPPPGSAMPPRMGPLSGPRMNVPPPQLPQQGGPRMRASGYGSVSIRVQPRDAEILVDGERWNTSEGSSGLNLELAAGTHRVEVQKSGYRPFSSEINVLPGANTPVNVSLSLEGRQ